MSKSGAVSAVVNSKRKNRSRNTGDVGLYQAGVGYFSDMDHPKAKDPIERRIEEFDAVFEHERSRSMFGLSPSNAGQSEASFREQQLHGLIKRIEERQKLRVSYCNLLSTMTFLGLYITVIYLQKSTIQYSCMVQRSVMNTVVNEIGGAPTQGYTASGIGTTSFLASQSEFLSWFNVSILQRIFVDVVCGDGKCSQSEYPAVGRFGCESDCGPQPNRTMVTVDLNSFLKSRPVMHTNKWDLSQIQTAGDPAFKFNIYSDSLQDYIFDTDQMEGTVNVDLLDGIYYLELYQTQRVSTKFPKEDFFATTNIASNTVPEREAKRDYAYGDYREFLAVSASIVDAVFGHCFGADTPLTPSGSEDTECPHFFQQSFFVRAFSSYGLGGSVEMKNGNKKAITLLEVPYCSVFPNGSMGLGGMRRFFRGVDMGIEWVNDGAAENIPVIMGSSTPCEDSLDVSGIVNLYRSLDADGDRMLAEASRLAADSARGHLPNDGGSDGDGVSARAEAAPVAISGVHWTPPNHWLRRGGGAGAAGLRTEGSRGLLTDQVTMSESSGLTIVVRGPLSALGGPGYPDSGTFWAVVNITRGFGVPGAATVRYSLDAAAPPTCGSSGTTYDGPFLVADPAVTKVTAITCVGANASAPGVQALNIKVGPTAKIVVQLKVAAVVDTFSGKAVAAKVGHALCWRLGVNAELCAARIVPQLVDATTVTAVALAESNVEAAAWRAELVRNASTATIYYDAPSGGGAGLQAEVQSVDVSVPVPYDKLRTIGQPCSSHYDCVGEVTATTTVNGTEVPQFAWGRAFCAKWGSPMTDGTGPTCDFCRLYCTVAEQVSNDGMCPEGCGSPWAGTLPPCLSAETLRQTYSCTSRQRFEVRVHTAENMTMPDPRKQLGSPLRTLSPFNNILGAIVVTQTRTRRAECSNGGNARLTNFTRFHSILCAGERVNASQPFGVDPAFSLFSSLYNGKHAADEYYNGRLISDPDEHAQQNFRKELEGSFAADGTFVPYGFFPHEWDTVMRVPKNRSAIWPGAAGTFKLYFDARIGATKAQELLTFMQDGGFLDESTDKVVVEMVTYNAEVGLFAIFSFSFVAERTGDIRWDYTLRTVDANAERSLLRTVLEALVIVLLAVNVAVEFVDILADFRALRVWEYLGSPFNMLDWAGFLVQIVAWVKWYSIEAGIAALELEQGGNYLVLIDPFADIRPFRTDPAEELKLLRLIDTVSALADLQVEHSTLTGITVVFFTFKVIKSLDFHPRMGLITRTLEHASSNLAHFMALFLLVFFGYAVVGNIMFGSQFGDMATLPRSVQTLMFILMSFDPTQFHAQMSHAVARSGSTGDEFQLYLWSYVFVSIFILLNVLLAILVSAYTDIAQASYGTKNILLDLAELADYNLRRLILPVGRFVSDEHLLVEAKAELDCLAAAAAGGDCDSAAVAQDASRGAFLACRALVPRRAMLLGSGVSMDVRQIKTLVHRVLQSHGAAGAASAGETFASGTGAGSKASLHRETSVRRDLSGGGGQSKSGCGGGASSQNAETTIAAQTNDLAEEIMWRFGDDLETKGERMSEELRRLLRLESQGRLLRMEARLARLDGAVARVLAGGNEGEDRLPEPAFQDGWVRPPPSSLTHAVAGGGAPIVAWVTPPSQPATTQSTLSQPTVAATAVVRGAMILEVTMVAARNLPRMDVLISCDAYGSAFLAVGDDGRHADQYHTTHVVRSLNPVWEEGPLVLVLPAEGAAPGRGRRPRRLVVAVWDHHKFRSDDLLGGADIYIDDLVPWKEVDEWYALQNPDLGRRIASAAVRVRALLRPETTGDRGRVGSTTWETAVNANGGSGECISSVAAAAAVLAFR